MVVIKFDETCNGFL